MNVGGWRDVGGKVDPGGGGGLDGASNLDGVRGLMRHWRLIAWLDARMLLADAVALLLLFVPLLVTALAYFGLRPLLELATTVIPMDVARVERIVHVMVLLMGPFMVGTVGAFTLIEERDGGIHALYAVSPVSPLAVLWLRLAAPVALQVVVAAGVAALFGIGTGATRWLILAVVAAEAPLVTLFLTAYAPNRLGAMSLSKALTVLLIVPLLALDMVWPLSAWVLIIPPAWPFWMALAGSGAAGVPGAAVGAWAWSVGLGAGGLLYHAGCLTLLARAVRRRLV